MVPLRYSVLVALVALILTACRTEGLPFASGFGTAPPSQQYLATIPNFSRQTAITTYLTGRPLDSIEGIWSWTSDDFEVAIVKNTFADSKDYAYVGILTKTSRSEWQPGEMKLLIRAGPSPVVRTGRLFMRWSDESATFVPPNPDMLQIYLSVSREGAAANSPEGSLVMSNWTTASTWILYRSYPETR